MTFWSALLLGLLAAGHCAGMCGGLQSAMQQTQVIRSPAQARLHLMWLNIGRLLSYVGLGLVFAAWGAALQELIDIPAMAAFMRTLAAIMLLCIGSYLLLRNQSTLLALERLGSPLWRAANSVLAGSGSEHASSASNSLRQGLLWGFLPCGLLYAVLLTTMFASSAADGALTMLGFGLGTLPAMLLTGSVYQQFRHRLGQRSWQNAGGMVFSLAGLLMLTAPLWVSQEFVRDYPILMNGLFCLT